MNCRQVIVKIRGTAERSYSVWIGQGILKRLADFINLSRYSNVVIAADRNAGSFWLEKLTATVQALGIIEIESGEQFKTALQAEKIWQALSSLGANRHTLMIILGGGVAGDLGGFAASTYMRGIDFLQIPTTLLAQVDASIGGKVAIDAAGVKNLVGAFRQPVGVLVDVDTLSTLPKRELFAGFAEILKHGLIADGDYFKRTASLNPAALGPDKLSDAIQRSCEIKAAIVNEDEQEEGPRKKLNFGHTIGHAIESALLEGPAPLLHGEAVAVGMVAECFLSTCVCNLDQAALRTLEDALKHFQLPIRLPQPVSNTELFYLMQRDKKNIAAVPSWSLLPNIGQCIWDQQVEQALVHDALKYIQPERSNG
jgi:3-dehydroquinate synthase